MGSLLFYIQLVLYIGYMAIVLKLMVKDTMVFMIYIVPFTTPYSVLFNRMSKYGRPADDCDPEWKNMMENLVQ